MEQENTPCLVAYEAFGPQGGHKKRWSTDFVCVSCQVVLPHENEPKERDIWFPTRETADAFVELIGRVCNVKKVEISDFSAPDKQTLLAGSCVDIKYNEGHFPTGTTIVFKDDAGKQRLGSVCGISRKSADSLTLYVAALTRDNSNLVDFPPPIAVESVQRVIKAGDQGYQYSETDEAFCHYNEELATMEHYIVKCGLLRFRDRHHYDVDAILKAIGQKIRRWSVIEQSDVLNVRYVNQFLKKNRTRYRLSISEVRQREKERVARQSARFKELLERMQDGQRTMIDKGLVKQLGEAIGIIQK